MDAKTIVDFWMLQGQERSSQGRRLDGALTVRFGAALKQARPGVFDHWGETPEGHWGSSSCLISFAQHYRGSRLLLPPMPKRWSWPKLLLAVVFTDAATTAGLLAHLPFETCGRPRCAEPRRCLFGTMGQHEMVYYAQIHLDIIARFGRFPHRNAVLGRRSTAAEIAFLQAGGFTG